MKQRVAIALGSNLGDRAAHIATARDALRQLACNDQPFLQAPLYESAPVDCPPDSNPFLNTTIECSFNNLSPLDLLNFCRQLEQNAKRDSPRPRNAPRTLDVHPSRPRPPPSTHGPTPFRPPSPRPNRRKPHPRRVAIFHLRNAQPTNIPPPRTHPRHKYLVISNPPP